MAKKKSPKKKGSSAKKKSPKKKKPAKRTAKKKAAPKKRKPAKRTAKKKPARKKARPAPKTPSFSDVPSEPSNVAPEIEKFYEQEKKLLSTPELSGPSSAPMVAGGRHKQVKPEDRYAIHAIIWSIIGVLIPFSSIVGFLLGVIANKKGSNLGKGAIVLAIVTFILNIIFIQQLMVKFA